MKREKVLTGVCMCVIACFLLYRAVVCDLAYAEIDSNALPVISLQYRGSILVNQFDIERARSDFKQLYKGIKGYEDLRSSKLLKVTDETWMPYYFPIYPLFCIPVKLLLAAFHRNQIRTFSITNALLLCLAFYFVLAKLKRPMRQRLIALALLFFSPAVFFYYNYINYEVFIFSMLTIALVQYSNKKYKSSAFALSLAGMSNSAVMAVGIVMVAAYMLRVLGKKRGVSFGRLVRENFRETVLYALCFVPCLLPFAAQGALLQEAAFSVGTSQFDGLAGRALMYLFDLTLGVPTFAPLAILLFCVLAVWGILRGKKDALLYGSFLLLTIVSVSLMMHINCSMIFCARYIVWIYPIIPMFLATSGYEMIRVVKLRRVAYFLVLATSLLTLYTNRRDTDPYYFNTVSKWVLNKAPALYNPIASTFYCRTLHADGAYGIREPVYYVDPLSEEVRKLVYMAEPGMGDRLLTELTGDESGLDYLRERVETIGQDGRYHYINFPEDRDFHIRAKNLAELRDLTEGETLIDESDFYLKAKGEWQHHSAVFRIKANTVYKVELELINDFDKAELQNMIVDFYAPQYDNQAQQAIVYADMNKTDYTFYFDSGELPPDLQEAEARILCPVDRVIRAKHIGAFRVTEMRAGSPDGTGIS